ncbi:hypothetical protein C8J27_11069 [Rhodobacter aestuarii]|uniref:Uncharacterized protein n=1 Tax=Rhodobacter aestuarii TaxID=453582 RepID=A0A1N7Q144_9RHOB|nr:hypothetical protein [Rhodobacter aestuarii]PTV94018.1 hypothetical protein C8J27_11069 [Rhodobacter aestuarii]SIT16613.1 hypothetical protein SAMN05421580_11269 [Rhodobacter aestuarii]
MAKFVMVSKHLYWWPVTVRMPDPDNAGQFLEQSFEMQFEAQPREAVLAHKEHYDTLTTDRERIAADKEQMRAVCRSWRGVIDEEGADVPFAQALLDDAVGLPWFRTGVMRAIAEASFGQEAKTGN